MKAKTIIYLSHCLQTKIIQVAQWPEHWPQKQTNYTLSKADRSDYKLNYIKNVVINNWYKLIYNGESQSII